MKKIRLKEILVWIWIASIVVFAATYVYAESKTFVVLDNMTTVGAGPAILVPYKVYSLWTCDALISGHPDNVTVSLEGNVSGIGIFSSEGMALVPIPASGISEGIYSFGIVGMSAKAIRGRVVSMTGGVNPSVSMYCVGVE